jgi:membrane protease YdiL (CAAX protease family)
MPIWTRSKAAPRSRRSLPRRDDYWALSTSALHTLAMLAPLVVLYELGVIFYLRDVGWEVLASRLLGDFLKVFGLAGLLVPGLAVLSVLLMMHVLRGDRWEVRPVVVIGMVLESVLWALPLVVFARLLGQVALVGIVETGWPGGGGVGGVESVLALPEAAGAVSAAGPATIMDLTAAQRATIALGAGLYEEFLFRLVLIAGLHFVLDDMLKMGRRLSGVLAVLASAVVFTLYHPVTAGDHVLWGRAIFYFAAGIFFACLYLSRGLGVAVGAHVAYDLIALRAVPLL